jgi:hypothetical protein
MDAREGEGTSAMSEVDDLYVVARRLIISVFVLPFEIRFGSAAVALLSAVACLAAGCTHLSVYGCKPHEKRCTADGVETCDGTDGLNWHKETCAPGAVCVEGVYECIPGAVKDARCSAANACVGSAVDCVGSGLVCDGRTAITCHAGYAVEVKPCPRGATCVVTAGTGACIATPTLDPACTDAAPNSDYYVCSDNAALHCKGAYLVGTQYCDLGECIRTARGADCGPPGLPSPICANNYSPHIVCDGSSAIRCSLGNMTSRKVCRSCSSDADAVPCTGALLAPCVATSDCADGFVCRANQSAALACSAACVNEADCNTLSQGTTEYFGSPSFWWQCLNGWCE